MSNRPTTMPTACFPFLFQQKPLWDDWDLAGAISSFEPLSTPVNVIIQDVAPQGRQATIRFENHTLRLLEMPGHIPEQTLQNTISVSHWSQDAHKRLLAYTYHIACLYEGTNTDPIEQLIAVYKVAASIRQKRKRLLSSEEVMLGLLDEAAWTCMPTNAIEMCLQPASLAANRQMIPLGLVTGFVKFFKPDGNVWFCTKGHHRFNVPDFACLAPSNQSQTVFDLFIHLFRAVWLHHLVLQVGETAQIGSTNVRFDPVYEYENFLRGPEQTLVVTMT